MATHKADRRDLVAVINSNEDIVDLICESLEEHGIHTVRGHVPDFKRGRVDLEEYFRSIRPRVAVWDIAPPYDENWEYFVEQVQACEACQASHFILTTTNQRVLTKLVGETGAMEIIGKPFDLQRLVEAVQRYLAAP